MSNLLFNKVAVLQAAIRVKDEIQDENMAAKRKAWDKFHAQGMLSRLLRQKPKPIPPFDEQKLTAMIRDLGFAGMPIAIECNRYSEQAEVANQFIKYCNRGDAFDTIAISRTDAKLLYLV